MSIIRQRARRLVASPALYSPGGGGGGASTTTWDPSFDPSNVALSNGDLTATNSTAGTYFTSTRSLASHSSGKFYCEFTNTTMANWNSIGFVNASWTPETGSNNIGDDGADSFGISFTGANRGTINGTDVCVCEDAGSTAGTIFGMAVDFTNMLIWIISTLDDTWYGAIGAGGSPNPSTGAYGGSISAIGGAPFYLATTLSTPGNAITLNTGGSAYNFSAPSGFGNW